MTLAPEDTATSMLPVQAGNGSRRAMGTTAEDRLHVLLEQARQGLGLSISYIAQIEGTTHRVETVSASDAQTREAFQGAETVLNETPCGLILEGQAPAVMKDMTQYPDVAALDCIVQSGLKSYVSVPIRFSDGSLYGTFCACDPEVNPELRARDAVFMTMLAEAAAMVMEPDVNQRRVKDEIRSRFNTVLQEGGPQIVLQPIVRMGSGTRVGAEALSRFPRDWNKAPDVCFEEAHTVGLGNALELAALRGAGDLLDQVPGYISMNVSPGTLLTPEFTRLMNTLPLDRVLLELSEHDQIADYQLLHNTLAPLRAQGMRLAIDDVGAGFSTLRHIVRTSPDVFKLDRGIVAGVATDDVLRALVSSLTEFAHGCGATVVAEGIETAEDANALTDLGVDHGQGWYYGRPGPASDLGPTG